VDQEAGGRFFREAWIEGVKKHYPGTPKSGYISPWSEMSQWEQESASAVYEQVRQFILVTGGQTTHLSREQKGRFVCLCWIGQIFKHFSDPKESYVADWEQLPEWQRETDVDIFESIERSVLQEVA
jgi:hypothetical protein